MVWIGHNQRRLILRWRLVWGELENGFDVSFLNQDGTQKPGLVRFGNAPILRGSQGRRPPPTQKRR
jgi:hypothetical protein